MTEATTSSEAPKTLEEHIDYFTSHGFKQVKESDNGLSRSITFRNFIDGDAMEVIVKQIGTHISVKQTVNGKPV